MQTTNKTKTSRSLDDSIQYIKGVGPKRALLLHKLGLETVEHCLYFIPHRYEDRSKVKKIGELIEGEQITFQGKVSDVHIQQLRRRRKILEVSVQDDTGVIAVKWFKFNEKYMKERYAIGRLLIVSGKPTRSRYAVGGLEIIHPDIDICMEEEADRLDIGSIIPIYSTTEGLYQKSLRAIMKVLVDQYASLLEEFLPGDIRRRNHLPDRATAFRETHFPPLGTQENLLIQFRTEAQVRLVFEELFLLQLGLAFKRKHTQQEEPGTPLKTRGDTIHRFMRLMPFELTGAQIKVLGHIMDDLEQSRPMNRLLHGDVGSGKTIVALISLLTAVDNGMQGALMAPTELLAEQHYLNIQPFCEALGIRAQLLTSAMPAKEKKALLKSIKEGATHIAIGTHALIQKGVEFKKLGLAVIDEQHRFGVLQREAISKKGVYPHVLVMTATPIPRSLAMTLYGDMDVSVLDEMPPGRKPIQTKRYYESQRDKAYIFLKKEVGKGRQAYVVCPLIEESETKDLKTVLEVYEDLQERFPEVAVALIHGKLKKEERQRIMAEFKEGKSDILVATTVIEVGIDVPNATVMLIEHSERLVLAQLHQLRGRVGRGKHNSYCLLVAYQPLTDDGKLRVKAMMDSCDGFKIAEQDLQIRGPGDFMGTRQSGMPTLRFANIIRDIKIIETTRKEAFALIDRDPKLEDPEHQNLKIAFQEYLGDRLDFMDIL
jgi:ATP-dependent DNA helicase RecG